MSKILRFLFLFFLIIIAIVGFWGYPTYKAIYGTNVPEKLSNPYIHIPTGSSYESILKILEDGQFIKDVSSFKKAAQLMKFDKRQSMRAGRFKLSPLMTNREIIQLLRAGKQSPVNVTLSYGRLPEDIASKVSKVIEADSLSIVSLFNNKSYLSRYDTDIENAMTYIIPNTYQFFWNTNAEEFWKRMVKEHQAFWTDERKRKADLLKLSQKEVYTLASIVEGETNYKPEKPTVAGVYLNRLKIGMLLQADPTLKFGTRDFDAKRVLNWHKEFDSPYNTYMYGGLPPGPIMMASISSIDAVLDYEIHDYLYFCAKPPKNIDEQPKEHAFAKTLNQHNANAQRYYAYLRKKGIR